MEQFNIHIQDGSKKLSNFVIEENDAVVELYDWQREAIKFFFDNDGKAVYEVATGCIVGDTFIEVPRNLDKYPEGYKIKNLVGKKDFYIYSFNIKKQKIELKKVKRIWKTGIKKVYEITLFSGKKIRATKNHPFLVDIKEKSLKGCGRGKREKIIDRKYIKLENLKVGYYLTTFNRSKIKGNDGEKIISIKYIGKEDVYDMEVEDNHNFIANGFIIHNSGKTFCAIEIIKEIIKKEPKSQFLIVVPKNVILEDTWFKELWENGFSIKDIGVYYGLTKEYGKITITNMQSLMNIEFELFDCIIFDEIHNYGTTRLMPIIEKEFKYKIGLSATLERMDNKHWKIIKAFNFNVFKYSPKKALRDGILNPFNFINIGINIDEDARENYEKLTEQLNKIMQAGGGFSCIMRTGSGLKFKMLALMNERKNLVNNYFKKFDVVREICKKHIDDKIIVFNEYNKQTNKCYWNLIESGVKACVVHSDLNKEKRMQNMIDFRKDKYNVMLASKVLDEGYNLPKIDTAVIMAGNSTSRQTIQRMGRVLRRKEKPSTLYQIYCRDTIEEDYAIQRAILFKDLCNNYSSFIYDTGVIEL